MVDKGAWDKVVQQLLHVKTFVEARKKTDMLRVRIEGKEFAVALVPVGESSSSSSISSSSSNSSSNSSSDSSSGSDSDNDNDRSDSVIDNGSRDGHATVDQWVPKERVTMMGARQIY